MSSQGDWAIPPNAQPKSADWSFGLEDALAAVLGVRALIPDDAFTASILGTERTGNGVLIRGDGVVLTIGYLITEAETVWLNTADGRALPGHVLGYDQETGFGLVQALGRLDLPALPLGRSGDARVGERVIVAGHGGRQSALVARVASKQEFAGYWEYVLDEAIFTAPAHPNWGGAAVIDAAGTVLGIGSLHLQQSRENQAPEQLNMIVPIDLLRPILDDMLTLGRPNRPPRPWLGMYATELEGKIVVAGIANAGPARRAKVQVGDVVLSVGEDEITNLASLFRRVWACGDAGAEVPLVLSRDGRVIEVRVRSADRARFLKAPRLH